MLLRPTSSVATCDLVHEPLGQNSAHQFLTVFRADVERSQCQTEVAFQQRVELLARSTESGAAGSLFNCIRCHGTEKAPSRKECVVRF